jgi:hypothetical protein
VNLLLAVFNLIPGFPLDGGRVFRAALWWLTGDAAQATRIASGAGRLAGWLIIAWGVWNVFVLRNPGGLWLVLIGWFLTHAARASYTQVLTERSLRAVRLSDVMRTRFETVPANATIEHFVEDYLLRSNQHLWPVLDGDTCIGMVSFDDAAALPAGERARRHVRDLVTPMDRSNGLNADDLAATALQRLAPLGDRPVPVLRGEQVVGLVRAGDILRWTVLHADRSP